MYLTNKELKIERRATIKYVCDVITRAYVKVRDSMINLSIVSDMSNAEEQEINNWAEDARRMLIKLRKKGYAEELEDILETLS